MIALQTFAIVAVITWGHIIPCRPQHNLVSILLLITVDQPLTLTSVCLNRCTWFWRYLPCSWYIKEAWGRKQGSLWHTVCKFELERMIKQKKNENLFEICLHLHQTHRQSRHEDLHIQLGKTSCRNTTNTKACEIGRLKHMNTFIKYKVYERKDSSFCIINDKDEQQILPFKELEPANVWHFLL